MLYNKTAQESDYALSDNFEHIANMRAMLEGTFTPWGTEFRRWEYGLVLTALRENGSKRVLEVGGGSSLFSAAAIWAGLDMTVLDPEDYTEMFRQQSERIGKQIPFVHADFFDYPESEYDACVCISVIEHVDRDQTFFDKLKRYVKPGGLLCLTTDFHPSGVAIFGGHNRTYNAQMLNGFIEPSEQYDGFEVFGDTPPDYSHFETNVHGIYTFASMVLRRQE